MIKIDASGKYAEQPYWLNKRSWLAEDSFVILSL